MAQDEEAKLQDELIDTAELARRTSTSPNTWVKKRMGGYGESPPYYRIGRSVRYSWPEFLRWLDTNKSTAFFDGQ